MTVQQLPLVEEKKEPVTLERFKRGRRYTAQVPPCVWADEKNRYKRIGYVEVKK